MLTLMKFYTHFQGFHKTSRNHSWKDTWVCVFSPLPWVFSSLEACSFNLTVRNTLQWNEENDSFGEWYKNFIWWQNSLVGKLPRKAFLGWIILYSAENAFREGRKTTWDKERFFAFFFWMEYIEKGETELKPTEKLSGLEERIPRAYPDEWEVNGCYPRANQQLLLVTFVMSASQLERKRESRTVRAI